MWWPFSRSEHPSFTAENTISAGTIVRGDLKSPSGLRIDGTVEGSVETEGPVLISESGTVQGSVTASDVTVLGGVRGDVRASGHLEIGTNGKIVGDISVQSVCMHRGGVFRGTSRMPGADELDEAGERGNAFGLLPFEPEAERRRTLPPPEMTAHDERQPPSAPKSEERLFDMDDDDDDQDDDDQDDARERDEAVNE